MANKKLSDNDLELILKKKESILKTLLDLSQLQLAENDSLGLDEILKNKDKSIEELKKIESILEKWYLENDRSLKSIEQNLDKNIQNLMEKILISEEDFEKILGQEKNEISIQISHITKQMRYRKSSIRQRVKIKNMKT